MTLPFEALDLVAVFLQTATETAAENATTTATPTAGNATTNATTNATASPTASPSPSPTATATPENATATEAPTPTLPDTPDDEATTSILVVTFVLLAYWAILAFLAGSLRVFIIGNRDDDDGEAAAPALQHFSRDFQSRMLTEIPWNFVKRATEYVRRNYYTKPWPTDKTAVVVTDPPDAVEEKLRTEAHFEGSPYSYDYEGATLDLRRPHGTTEEGVPRELHVRGRPIRGGEATELISHIEYSRYEAKQLHIDSAEVLWDDAVDEMMHILAAVADGTLRRVPPIEETEGD